MPYKPPGCRQPSHGLRSQASVGRSSSPTGASVPADVLADPGQACPDLRSLCCRPLAVVRDSSEGMPWASLVLSWQLHQMPRCGERCSYALQPIRHAAFGGVRLLLTFTCCGDSTYARPGLRARLRADHAPGSQVNTAMPTSRTLFKRRASEGDEARRTTNAAEDTRQRASGGRTCGRARTLGRTPSERNHRSVLRLLWRA